MHWYANPIISPVSCPSTNHIPTTQLYGTTCSTRTRQCGVSCQPLLYCGQWGFLQVAVDPSTWDHPLPDVGCWWDQDQYRTDIPDLCSQCRELQASIKGDSANASIAIQFNITSVQCNHDSTVRWCKLPSVTSINYLIVEELLSPPTTTVTIGDLSTNLSCDLYGYLMRQPSIITWSVGNDVLMNDSVFTITIQDGSHMRWHPST